MPLPPALGALLGAGRPAEGSGARQEGGGPGFQAGRRVARLPAPAGRRGRGPEAPGRGVDGGVGDLPRTLTGGLVHSMKTKLEIMVGYLAGRQGEDVESIRRELEDPSSEASRWLEAVRRGRGGSSARARRKDWTSSRLARADCRRSQTHRTSPGLRPADRTRNPGVREATVPDPLARLGRRGGAPCGGHGVAGPGRPSPPPRNDPGPARDPMGGPLPASRGGPHEEARGTAARAAPEPEGAEPQEVKPPTLLDGPTRAGAEPDREEARRARATAR